MYKRWDRVSIEKYNWEVYVIGKSLRTKDVYEVLLYPYERSKFDMFFTKLWFRFDIFEALRPLTYYALESEMKLNTAYYREKRLNKLLS